MRVKQRIVSCPCITLHQNRIARTMIQSAMRSVAPHQQYSPKKVNIIPSSIIPHQELIPSHNMLSETRSNSLVLSLRIPRLDPANPGLFGERARFHIRANTRLIVAEQVRILFVEHTVDFQDVAITSGSLELVAGAIEAEDECFLRGEDPMAVPLVLIARVVGCCPVVFFATRARFSASLLFLLRLVAMRLLGSVDSWLRTRSFCREWRLVLFERQIVDVSQ